MSKEKGNDISKTIGSIFWWLIKILWKAFLIVLWGFLRLVELISSFLHKLVSDSLKDN